MQKSYSNGYVPTTMVWAPGIFHIIKNLTHVGKSHTSETIPDIWKNAILKSISCINTLWHISVILKCVRLHDNNTMLDRNTVTPQGPNVDIQFYTRPNRILNILVQSCRTPFLFRFQNIHRGFYGISKLKQRKSGVETVACFICKYINFQNLLNDILRSITMVFINWILPIRLCDFSLPIVSRFW